MDETFRTEIERLRAAGFTVKVADDGKIEVGGSDEERPDLSVVFDEQRQHDELINRVRRGLTP